MDGSLNNLLENRDWNMQITETEEQKLLQQLPLTQTVQQQIF